VGILQRWRGELRGAIAAAKRAFIALKDRHDPLGHLVASLATYPSARS
jgi:hypothetical protein